MAITFFAYKSESVCLCSEDIAFVNVHIISNMNEYINNRLILSEKSTYKRIHRIVLRTKSHRAINDMVLTYC